MNLHESTFQYLAPTDKQLASMGRCREHFKLLADVLAEEIPDGLDKTYLLRKLREVGMWANIAITRQDDGAPRV